jgi:hypothetical protein
MPKIYYDNKTFFGSYLDIYNERIDNNMFFPNLSFINNIENNNEDNNNFFSYYDNYCEYLTCIDSSGLKSNSDNFFSNTKLKVKKYL